MNGGFNEAPGTRKLGGPKYLQWTIFLDFRLDSSLNLVYQTKRSIFLSETARISQDGNATSTPLHFFDTRTQTLV